ncbi:MULTISPECIES: histone-like nucleoid-structuring protein, MvaT/MvaU family [unclassified Halomonas]|uniref:histone-like nucleoid-structuring protein, MvaT/MvaU family n=1 Tax=unclassified Halomonas TaxID=2609666 RepID=UPI000558B52F|nr:MULTISPECIES: histone-like nucleoid-structuring protein, MvaT/MvaU family [unclassified Halomonas]CEP36243.1 Transcriptional regulator MvaT, P16 subunit [Halomonas sp. R57-5]
MSSVLSDYIKKEQMLKQLQAELKALEDNSELKKEIEFKEKLQALMTEYGKLAQDVCAMLDPSYRKASNKSTKTSSTDGRKKRPLKVYKNPHSGEVVETRGGNHKVIQEWKAKFGNEEVVSWVVEERV